MAPSLFQICVGCILVVVVILFWNNSSGHLFQSDKTADFKPWHDCFSVSVKEIETDSKALWNKFGDIVGHCENTTLKSQSFYGRLEHFMNFDEQKHHIAAKSRRDPLVVVSVGVGLDTVAERKLKSAHPRALLYGVDPGEGNQVLYEDVGTYYKFAVGDKNGQFTMQTINTTAEVPHYMDTVVPTIELSLFLSQVIRPQNLIYDNIWIDNESAEYSLFPLFRRNGTLDQNGIVVCQFNVEIHNPKEKYVEDFRQFILGLVEDRRYAVASTSYEYSNYRSLFINYDNPICIERYL